MKRIQLIPLEQKKNAQLAQSASMTPAERFHYMLELIRLSDILSPNRPPKTKEYFRIFTLKRSEPKTWKISGTLSESEMLKARNLNQI